jgi:c-di-AMP phosphodiesterase-like protein
MKLRSGKSSHIYCENIVLRSGTVLDYTKDYSSNTVSKPFDFDEWLMSRIKTCIETMNLLYENHDKYLIERARILCEVCYLLNEYFNDIFLDIEKNHIHNIALRLKEWVKEITNAMVNTNNFTLEEKSFLGNTRRDIDLLYIRLLNI